MATNGNLIDSAIKRITTKFDETELQTYDDELDYKETTFSCRNTRVITVRMFIPHNKTQNTDNAFYTLHMYGYITEPEQSIHYDITTLAQKILEIGYRETSLAELSPAELTELGFIPEQGTNIYAVANMLRPDNYKLVMSGEWTYNIVEDSGNVFHDTIERENLTIFDKVIAHRPVNVWREPYIQPDNEE